MTNISLSGLLDDLRAADAILRKFEQRYWLSSDVFYDLYARGLLDDGENLEDFAEWAGFYKIKQQRENLLREFSTERIEALRKAGNADVVSIKPEEPVIEIAR